MDAVKAGLPMQEKLACQCRKNWSADAGKAEMLSLVALAPWQTLNANQRRGFAPLGPDLRPAWIWLLGLRGHKSAPAAKAAALAWAVRPH
jgi:hypothetical protein